MGCIYFKYVPDAHVRYCCQRRRKYCEWEQTAGKFKILFMARLCANRGDGGSIPPTAVSKLGQLRSPHICLCLSEETLNAGGPFYLVSMPGEVKDHTQGVNV